MIKTQIQLEEWQYDALKRFGVVAERSFSDLVRESVSLFLKGKKNGALAPLETLAGKYTCLPTEDLKMHDRVWAESIR